MYQSRGDLNYVGDEEGHPDAPSNRAADRPATEPRTDWDDPALYPFEGMLPQCSYIVHWAHCRLDAGHDGRHSPGRLPAEAAQGTDGAAPLRCGVCGHVHEGQCREHTGGRPGYSACRCYGDDSGGAAPRCICIWDDLMPDHHPERRANPSCPIHEGAAPRGNAERAEGLLRRLVAVVDSASMHWTDPVPADSIHAIHDAKEYLASRPSDERVPESEEPVQERPVCNRFRHDEHCIDEPHA